VRARLVRETSITALHRVAEGDRAFQAAVYPLAVVARRQTPTAGHRVQLGFGSDAGLTQRRLETSGPWVLIPDRQHDAVARLLAAGEPLGTRVRPALGLKTGADRVFVGRVEGADGALVRVTFGQESVLIEPDLLRGAIRGRDIQPFGATPAMTLLYAYEGRQPLERLPAKAAAWIRRHRAALAARADYRSDAALWSLFRTGPATSRWRVAWADLARRPCAVLLEAARLERAIPLNTCYVAAAPDRNTGLLISAVLNSVWAAAYVSVAADEARGGYRRVNAQVVARLPLPPRCAATDRAITLAAHAHAGYPIDRAALDDALATAWELTAADRTALSALADRQRG
jgi:hypothetical protein